MKVFHALFWCALTAAAQNLTIEQMFQRPLLWGTSPDEVTWAKKGHTLVFLWNAEGRRFRDLYAYSPDEQKLARLTDLEKQTDELNLTEEEKDGRLKTYLLPQAGLASFDVSQDGRRVAFSYKGDLYLVNTDGKSEPLRLTRTKMPETAPQFSPDGAKLASVRGGQIIVQDLTNGQIWQATNVEGTTLEQYRWSPDGKSFVCLTHKGARQVPLANFSGRFVATKNIPRTIAGDEPGDFGIFLVLAQGGTPQVIEIGRPAGKGFVSMPEWSPDSKRLLTLFTAPDWKKKQVMVVDAHTLKAKVAAEETDGRWVDYGFAGWSPDSAAVFFTSEKDGWAHLYTMAADGGGEPKQLTHGDWEIHHETFAEAPQWVGDWIYFGSTEGDPAQRQTYKIRPDGSSKEKLSHPEGLNIALVSGDGRQIAWKLADAKNPLDLWVNEKRVTQSPRPDFYKQKWPEIQYVRYPSRGDKKPVAARVMLPPNYRMGDRSQKKRPAVVYIHGAGYATSVLKQWGSYQDFRYAYNTFLASTRIRDSGNGLSRQHRLWAGLAQRRLSAHGRAGSGRRAGRCRLSAFAWKHRHGQDRDLGRQLRWFYDGHGDVPFTRYVPRGGGLVRGERLGELQRRLHGAAAEHAAIGSGGLPAEFADPFLKQFAGSPADCAWHGGRQCSVSGRRATD